MKKFTITEKQLNQFNKMRNALIKIAKEYQTTKQLRKESEKEYGLEYEEALEMAFENMQSEAQYAVKGIKRIVKPGQI